MTLKLKPLPASPPPGRGIDPLVSDISGYHFGVPVYFRSLQYHAMQPAVNIPM
jgi:hypothetical protein